MNRLLGIGLLSLPVMLAAGQPAPVSAGRPATCIDEGVCPFECCTYRQWTVEQTTPAFERPDPSSPIVGSFNPGQRVVGLTGRVETYRPGNVRVVKSYLSEISGRAYQPSDLLWVYTYLGEGFFKVWYQGQMFEEEVAFVHHGMGGWIRCAEQNSCWGQVVDLPDSSWWVKVRSLDGWSDTARNFGDKDACG